MTSLLSRGIAIGVLLLALSSSFEASTAKATPNTPGGSTTSSRDPGGNFELDLELEQSILQKIREKDPRFVAVFDSIPIESFGREKISLPMNYNIFRGNSSLRSLSKDERDLLMLLSPQHQPKREVEREDAGCNANCDDDDSQKQKPQEAASNNHRALALLFVLKEKLEVAHELVLGVTRDELETAEYAATHPGRTSWSQDHPLDDSADWIHAIIHRLEGSTLGEGNQPGYENAKYWILGGPKLLERPVANHPVRKIMAECAPRIAPVCVSARGLLSRCSSGIGNYGGDGEGDSKHGDSDDDNDTAIITTKEYSVLAGGGKTRKVVPSLNEGEWDDLAFIELCRLREEQETKEETNISTAAAAAADNNDGNTNTHRVLVLSETECREIVDLQRFELLCLLQLELRTGTSKQAKQLESEQQL